MDIFVMNQTFDVIGVIDQYEDFAWDDRYCEYGEFELKTPLSDNAFSLLIPGNYIKVLSSDRVMIIENINFESDINDGTHIVAEGRSLESLLTRRVVWGQKTFTGDLQPLVQTLINENFVNPTITDRAIPNFKFVSCDNQQLTYMHVDIEMNGENVYDVIQSLCEEHGVGFRILLTADKKMEFSLYVGEDRSYAQSSKEVILFSPRYDNIADTRYKKTTSSYKNVALIGGEGNGDKKVYETFGEASGLDRRETFVEAYEVSSNDGDIDDETYSLYLKLQGKIELAENQVREVFDGELVNTEMFKMGEDYFLGDIIQMEDGYGHTGRCRVSKFIISHSSAGYKMYPIFEEYSKT